MDTSLERDEEESSSRKCEAVVEFEVAEVGVGVGSGLVTGVCLGLIVDTGLALTEVGVVVEATKDGAGLRVDANEGGAGEEVAKRAAIGGRKADPDEDVALEVDVDMKDTGGMKGAGMGGIISTSTGLGLDFRLKNDEPDFLTFPDACEGASER